MTEHLQHVETVMEGLRQQKLWVFYKKSSFVMNSISYLGCLVDRNGLHIDPTKVRVIVEWPAPTSFTKLRSYIGMTNYLQKFLTYYFEVTLPMNTLKREKAEFKCKN